MILDGEFIQGLDGKFRYFKPVRIEMYKFMRKQIENWAGFNPGIYMCMESDEIWRHTMGFMPSERGGIGKMLDQAVALR